MSGTGSSSSSGSGGNRKIIGFTVKKRTITIPISATVSEQYCETITEECSDTCGSGSGSSSGSGSGSGSGEMISTPCGDIPATLLVDVSTGESFTITYDSIEDWWTGLTGNALDCPPALSFGLVMRCLDDAMWIGVVASWRGPASSTPTSVSFSPFLLTYVGMDDGGGACIPESISFTVSELP